MDRVLKTTMKFGFLINWDKSRLKPQKTFTWLGLQWSLDKGTLSLTRECRLRVIRSVRNFRTASSFTRRELERLMGLLLFASVVDPILKTTLKDLNRVLVTKARRRRRDLRVPMQKKVQALLKPWANRASLKRSVPLVPPPISVTINTDASLEGWGGHSETKAVSGLWSPSLKMCHINVLELMAVFLTLRSLRPPKGSHIRLFIDNQVAVGCIQRGGS